MSLQKTLRETYQKVKRRQQYLKCQRLDKLLIEMKKLSKFRFLTNNSFDQVSFYLQTTIDIFPNLQACVGNPN